MKLSTLALSVAVILGAAATGGSWYTGKQAEARYQALVAIGNQKLQPLRVYGLDVQIKNVKLDRHLFSSDVHYQLEATSGGETYRFEGADKLFHGPFPLNRLSKGKLLPAMLSVESHITVPDTLKAVVEQPELLTAETDIYYSQATSGQFSISPFNNPARQWTVGNTTGDFEWQQGGDYQFNITLPHFALAHRDQGKPAQLRVDGFRYQVNGKQQADYPFLNLGEFEGKINALTLSGKDGTAASGVKLENLVMRAKNALDQGAYQGAGDLEAKVALIEGDHQQSLGKLTLDLLMKSDASASNQLMALLQNIGSTDKKAFEQAVMAALEALVKKPWQYQLKTLTLENAQGKNQLALDLHFNGIDPANFGHLESILNSLNHSAIDGSLHLAAAETMFAQLISLDPAQQAMATARAKEVVQGLVDRATQHNIAVQDHETLKFHLAIDQGDVILNGNRLPKEQVNGMLFMLMLGLGGGFR